MRKSPAGHTRRKRSAPWRAIVGIDFSPESRRALAVARRFAARSGAKLTAVHVRPISNIRAAVVEERGDLIRAGGPALGARIQEHYRARLAKFLGDKHREMVRLLRGRPGHELSREARRGYELIFVGRRGRGLTGRGLLGSTVQELLAVSPVPVLVVGSAARVRRN